MEKTIKHKIIHIILKLIGTFICIALFLLALPSYLIAANQPRASIGSIILMAVCVIIVFMIWASPLREFIKSKKWPRRIYRICFWLFVAIGIVALFLSVLILVGMNRTPPADKDMTVVVLGCKVNGHYPSLMLSRRLQIASEYLNANPNAKCIVTGGQGPDEITTEASVMYDYLVNRGIAPDRIYQDTKASNTYENLKYSAEIIEKQNLPKSILVVTDSFHQYRSHMKATEHGLEPYAVNAKTDWWLYTGYFAREIIALAKTFVVGG